MKGFVHLHCHSNYSLLEGASRIEEMLARARDAGMEALALTETNGLYGAMPFLRKAREFGVRPILGAAIEHRGRRAVCLARNRDGYASLCELVTERRLCGEGFDLAAALVRCQEGLTILTPLPDLLARLAGRIEPGRLFAEVQRFPATNGAPRLDGRETLRAAAELRLPPAASNAVHFAAPSQHLAHVVLTAIRQNTLISEVLPQEVAHPEAWLKDGGAMAALFADLPEALANARRIADECRLDLGDGKPIFPRCELADGETPFSRLWKLAFHGAARRYRPLTPAVMERLRRELRVINALGFAEYFLIVHEIVRFAHSRNIPTVGRGSAADSLVAYCLGITSVDPLAHDLYFERFLNMQRTDCPDIDLDICWKRRDEVLDHVYARYGHGCVAMVANHNTYQARSAFRDAARVMGLPLDEINTLSKMLPYSGVHNIREAMKNFPETRGFPIDREPYRTAVAVAEAIDGFPRHLSIHAGGIVIGDRPLTHYVPLERAAKGLVICQYDKNGVEDIGLVKIDLLGQRSLSIITDAVAAVRAHHGVEVDVRSVPDGDPRTAELIGAGRTMGCFQIESPGMRSLLRQMRARNRLDLIIGLSLIRPGPAGSGMKEHFVLRRLGKKQPEYLHPKLRDILGATYGVMLYQEDILRVAEAAAGFTLEEGDQLRKAISKKRSPEEIARLRERFIRGALERGGAPDDVERLWQQVANFAAYSYCKAHATTYGYISYQACWLKAHYPAEFLAAVVANQAGYYELREYFEEARRLGVRILPPDVNASGVEHRAEKDGIRVGLMAVKGLSQRAMRSMLAARAELPFGSLADLLARARLTRPEAEALVLCGALDRFGATRPQVLWKLQILLGAAPTAAVSETPLLFAHATAAGTATAVAAPPAVAELLDQVPPVADYSLEQKLALEQEWLGLTVSDRAIAPYEARLRRRGPVPADRLERFAGRRVTVAGMLVTMRHAVTKRQEYMKFVTIEDRTGTIEAVLFPDAYQRFGHLFATRGPYIITGAVESHNGSAALTVERVELLERS